MKKKTTSLPGDPLSQREIEIICLISDGLSSKEIGDALFISPRTVDNHRARIMGKLGARNTVDLVKYAILTGIYPLKTDMGQG